jgi:hypothetical protein
LTAAVASRADVSEYGRVALRVRRVAGPSSLRARARAASASSWLGAWLPRPDEKGEEEDDDDDDDDEDDDEEEDDGCGQWRFLAGHLR